MKITVLNGSPKGDISVTVQYVKFIQKKYPQYEFSLINIAHDIARIEKDRQHFQSIIEEVKSSAGVMWAFPLYVFLVCSQYKRFIELIYENKVQAVFRDKYTCALSTSIHFFDNTAHNYIRGICDDLDMKFTESFSADMDDLFNDESRRMLLKWAGEFLAAIENRSVAASAYAPLTVSHFAYSPGKTDEKIDNTGLKIKLLADIEDERSNIARMVNRFAEAFKEKPDIIRYRDIDMKGGCLGCMQCAFDNICVYNDKDSFTEFFNSNMRDQDVTIFAGNIKDRYFSSRMKMFWDRAFFNGHIPTHTGKQMGFLVSGPLGQLANLQEIMQATAEMGGANLTGIVTDESSDSKQIDALLEDLAAKCVDNARQKYIKPVTFLGTGGHKIFRDAIWARLRFPFDADFRYYESHGLFDFPQADSRYLEYSSQMIKMIEDPKMREMVRKMIKTEILKGYQKIVELK